jgi:DNA uptake protein ComE-like DNA-binding protein
MKQIDVKTAIVTIILIFVANNSLAETSNVGVSHATTNSAVKKLKLIDVNSAKKSELMKLPGINEADAEKIISARPFGSKTWLVSESIIDEAKYFAIRGLIFAKQPFKDGAKNAEFYKAHQSK